MAYVEYGDDGVLRCATCASSPYWMSEWDLHARKAIGCQAEFANIISHFNPRNVLVLGLGGGVVIGELVQKLPDTKIVAVEIDDCMIRLATEHFFPHFGANRRVTVVNTDVMKFETKERFDVVLGDVPHFYEAKTHQNTREMLRLCASWLGTDRPTLMIFNVLTRQNARIVAGMLRAAKISDDIHAQYHTGNWFIVVHLKLHD